MTRWLALAAVAALALTISSPAAAADKFFLAGATSNEASAIVAFPNEEVGELAAQQIHVFGNGTVTCEDLEMAASLTGRVGRGQVHGGDLKGVVVHQMELTDIDFSGCVQLGMPARVDASSCDLVITGSGRGTLVGKGCDLTISIPGCNVHLGAGPFMTLGYTNRDDPADIAAITEPVAIGGTAVGAGCPTPGPEASGQHTGYLRFSASRDGEDVAFEVAP